MDLMTPDTKWIRDVILVLIGFCTCRQQLYCPLRPVLRPGGHNRLDAKVLAPGPVDQGETVKVFQEGGGSGWGVGERWGDGCGAESKGSDLLFQSEKELMADHRNSGSEIHRVPGGQLVQWTPPLPSRSESSCRNLRQASRRGSASVLPSRPSRSWIAPRSRMNGRSSPECFGGHLTYWGIFPLLVWAQEVKKTPSQVVSRSKFQQHM